MVTYLRMMSRFSCSIILQCIHISLSDSNTMHSLTQNWSQKPSQNTHFLNKILGVHAPRPLGGATYTCTIWHQKPWSTTELLFIHCRLQQILAHSYMADIHIVLKNNSTYWQALIHYYRPDYIPSPFSCSKLAGYETKEVWLCLWGPALPTGEGKIWVSTDHVTCTFTGCGQWSFFGPAMCSVQAPWVLWDLWYIYT